MTTGIELKFPAPNRPLSENESRRMHWAARKRRLEPWRESVGWEWMASRSLQWKVKDIPCTVEVQLPFAAERRRDPHNFVGTNVKALVDALVQLGVWPDDTPAWVTVIEPTLVVGDEVVVRLTPRGGEHVGSTSEEEEVDEAFGHTETVV